MVSRVSTSEAVLPLVLTGSALSCVSEASAVERVSADNLLSQLEPRISHHAGGAERSREHLQVSIQLMPVLFQVLMTFLATSRWSDLEDEPVMSDTVAYDMHTLRRYLSSEIRVSQCPARACSKMCSVSRSILYPSVGRPGCEE